MKVHDCLSFFRRSFPTNRFSSLHFEVSFCQLASEALFAAEAVFLICCPLNNAFDFECLKSFTGFSFKVYHQTLRSRTVVFQLLADTYLRFFRWPTVSPLQKYQGTSANTKYCNKTNRPVSGRTCSLMLHKFSTKQTKLSTVQFDQERPAVKPHCNDFACMICANVSESLQQPRLNLNSQATTAQVKLWQRNAGARYPNKQKKKKRKRKGGG